MISRSSGIVWSRPNTIKTRSRTGPTRTRSRTDPGNTWSRTDPTSNLSTKYWENLDRFNFLGLHILSQLDPLNCRNRQSYVLCRFNVVIKQLVLSVAWKSIYNQLGLFFNWIDVFHAHMIWVFKSSSSTLVSLTVNNINLWFTKYYWKH